MNLNELPEGLSLAAGILQAQGGQRYFADWADELVTGIKAATLPDEPVIVKRRCRDGEMREQRLAVTHVSAGRSRSFDYNGLRQRDPLLYKLHVQIAEPRRPLTIVFGKTPFWNTFRSEGFVSFSGVPMWAERRAEDFRLSSAAQTLADVRERKRFLKQREDSLRDELAFGLTRLCGYAKNGHVVLPPQLPKFDFDGLALPVSRVTPKRSIDLDAAELHPVLRAFVKTKPRDAYDVVRFVNPDGTDDDESEDALGSWNAANPL